MMVETLEASVVWELPRVEVEKLIDQYHDIERLYRGFIEHSLIESQVKRTRFVLNRLMNVITDCCSFIPKY
ncbi:cyclic nucleotide-binding protein [Phocaeicola vulgatus]|uniref:Cyclic nucleotide-binding protein n=1 Tax=Phocaeicola vulgatus TaxID=821 RepID=A0A0P0M4A6_PHOVU|nr:cyclic nucleotide-binding protein [Phocaeicola vulgatus]